MKKKLTAVCFEWIKPVLFAVCLAPLIIIFLLRLVDVDGPSMMDTLQNQDKVIVTSFLYQPQPGDIIAISHGENIDKPLIKRVIAVEGQKIEINEQTGDVFVDGVLLSEPYIKNSTIGGINWDFPSVVPEGKVFVMGDNRLISKDSRDRDVGLIHTSDIIGKAQAVVFPFGHVKYLY